MTQQSPLTPTEILHELHSSDMPEELRAHLSQFIAGQLQFVYNMLHTANFGDSIQSKLINHPDWWEQGYNQGVAIYQEHGE